MIEDPEEKNSAIVVHYQYKKSEIKNTVIFDFISNFINVPFFSKLRTEEQLGYIV